MKKNNIFKVFLFAFVLVCFSFLVSCGKEPSENENNNNGNNQNGEVNQGGDKETFTYKFVVDGVVVKEETREKGDFILYPKTPTKEKDQEYTYTFSNWDNDATTLEKDEVFNAVFTETRNQYLIKFYGLNNQVLSSTKVEYGVVPTAPNVTSVSATNIYTLVFDGWDKEIEAVTKDANYVAKYKAIREELTSLEGLKVSFLGDSITTFYQEGSLHNNMYKDGYEGINNYYPSHSATVKTWEQTWWGQLVTNTSMEVGIVNALSGSMAYDYYKGEDVTPAMHDKRVSALDDNGCPDIVIVFIGTNDICSSYPDRYGREQYTIALQTIIDKIHNYCSEYTDVFLVQMYVSNTQAARIKMYNEVIDAIANKNNCGIIEYYTYMSSVKDQNSILPDWTHPSLKGCGILARASEKAIKDYYNIPNKIKVVQ